jgi:hypothetical protein
LMSTVHLQGEFRSCAVKGCLIDKYALQKKCHAGATDGGIMLRSIYSYVLSMAARSTLTIGDRVPSPIHIGGSDRESLCPGSAKLEERQCALLRHPSSVIGTNMRPVCRQGLKVCPAVPFQALAAPT